jgi:hypothetical protein
MGLHPEDTEASLRLRGPYGNVQAEAQDPARLCRIDDTVIP